MQHPIFEFALRAALIAAGTAAVLRLLRIKTAAARHGAWAGVLISMMLLPIWTAWGPKASVRVLPAVDAPASGAAMVPAALSLPAPGEASYLKIPATPARRSVRGWWTYLAPVYLLGVCVLLARLVAGTVRAHTLVRRAAIREGRLTSSSCAAPVTVGWLTPTVILPECWRRWPQTQLDAVLTHEREHVRRRDPLVQWLALLNRAIFWFHPLAWWLERRISALAEEACDAAVLEHGHDPFDYSGYLLEIARSVSRSGARVHVLGMAMPGSFLPQRIRRILEARPAPRISRMRMACMAMACAIVSAVFAVGAVDRQQHEQRISAPTVAVQTLPAPVPFDLHPARAARTAMLAQVQAAPAPAAPPAMAPQKERRLLVLYFDLRAMPVIDRARAFAAAQGFVRTKMQSSDLLAIMTASDSVAVKQDFTGDRDRLLGTLDQLMSDSGPESGMAVDVDLQLAGLRTAVDMLGSLQGKKAVVYFAMPVARTEPAQLQPLIDAALRANVAFYTIDAIGLADASLQMYIIGAEDVIQIWVLQQPGLSGHYNVRPDGMISVPLIGDIRAAGLSTSQLEAVIAGRLEPYFDHPSVTVSVAEVHSRKR